jgi:large subunit ribosomal protein L4
VTTIDIVNAKGSKAGSVDLPAEIFDVQVNIPLMHQVVVAQQAAARQGTADTKTRGEIAGGGRKPYRQKGTGRARQGSIRAPQFAGGGVVHGPTPRSYDQRTPKKMKAAALRGALSDRAREGRVHVIEGVVDGNTPSTRSAIGVIAKLTTRPRTLVVLERGDDVTWLSLRNVDTIHVLAVDQLNTYDVLLSDDVVFTKGAYDAFVAGPATGKSVKAIATSTEAETLEVAAGKSAEKSADKTTKKAAAKQAEKATETKTEPTAEKAEPTEDSETPYGPGSAAPLESGEAPEGFTIKGNADSMKFHQPDGRWFEQTEPTVWFDSVESAEKAGFVEAGSKASIKANEDSEESK